MNNFSMTPLELCASFWRNRTLIFNLTKREIIGRYSGSMLGLLWSFFNPIFMLVVYTFVFSVVFQARWSEGGESKSIFALILFAGLIVYNIFAECINRSPTIVLANTAYVKKVVFPLEILPWVNIGAALFHAIISLLVWVIFYIIELQDLPPITALLVPFILIPLTLFIVGISWILAALGVYLRDINQLVVIITTVIMFLSPIFFPATALPEKYRTILSFNPLVPIIEQMRDVLYWGKFPDLHFYLYSLIVTAFIAWFGFAWFQKTRKGFADVI